MDFVHNVFSKAQVEFETASEPQKHFYISLGYLTFLFVVGFITMAFIIPALETARSMGVL